MGVLWVLVGYSLAFGTGGAFIGDLSKLGLMSVTPDAMVANFASPPRQIPELIFVMFQAMFAIITPALILGAVVERMKFSAFVVFISIWVLRRLLPDRAHGVVGRGLDLQGQRDRLRRRPRGAHVERLLGAGGRAHARQAPRLRQGADGPAQPAAVL